MFYKLDENKNVVSCSREEWANYFENANRHVADETIEGNRVSTVFLGINHNFNPSSNIPFVFETMIFDENGKDIYCKRCATWQEAEKQHKEAVEWLKELLK